MNALFVILGIVGPWQIILIIAIVLLLFGGKKIPELMRGLGSGIKEFKDATKEENTNTNSKNTSKDETNTNQ
ncbi:twin-arginine translocase TatA/TatE family subunit [Myroides guanonis]|uniref:Sec-independent protein translocase protein TatA n=1 Tax=Myroides guanonis TaxID=1150112 RepID=A0A1I3RLC5_9FLAO|nr:twin-arginine translocase TatA/TatE family subunit [Myroides guanonis]SFJ47048.1 sec-independent protein translocase protein TatA [Myroides guanonis]